MYNDYRRPWCGSLEQLCREVTLNSISDLYH
ncbi:hypothetical protein KEN49_CDS0361 [Pseudomonas phage vB_Pae3705-KEN49]